MSLTMKGRFPDFSGEDRRLLIEELHRIGTELVAAETEEEQNEIADQLNDYGELLVMAKLKAGL